MVERQGLMAEGIPDYDELKLRLEPGEGGAYRVRAEGPDGSAASGIFSPPFDETQLDNFVLRVGRPRRGVRASRSSQMEEAKRFGGKLFDALFQGEVRDLYLGAFRVAQENGRGLRVTLSLTDAPDLMQIPWEFLYERPSFLSQSIYTPLVRSLDLSSARPPRPLTLPLRILGMVSRPQGFETLDVDEERRKLEQALSVLQAKGMVELNWLEGATLSELNRVVAAPDHIHVLHYIGHGAYDERTEGGILVLEDDQGRPHEVTGEELGSLLWDEHSLRLVVLNSCEGARGSHVDPFSGVGSSLVEHRIPAVVGMQFEITNKAAITFADSLYTAIAQGFPIDAALAQARKAIWAAGGDIEFGTPVLFLRTADARLFDVQPSEVLTPEAIAATEESEPGEPSFTLQLERHPSDAEPGDRLTLQLTIENTGACELSEVAATDADGRSLAAPVELGPEQRYTIRWEESSETEPSRLVTVTATDPKGSRLCEEITARTPASEAAPPTPPSDSAEAAPEGADGVDHDGSEPTAEALAAVVPSRIFICYRREQTEWQAGRLYDNLKHSFGEDSVFMDVDAIGLGENWVKRIEAAVDSSEALLVVIGEDWLATLQAKLDSEDDYVRLEVARGLERGILVVPVIVQDTKPPGRADLPESLAELADRQAFKLTSFERDFPSLLEGLKKYLQDSPSVEGPKQSTQGRGEEAVTLPPKETEPPELETEPPAPTPPTPAPLSAPRWEPRPDTVTSQPGPLALRLLDLCDHLLGHLDKESDVADVEKVRARLEDPLRVAVIGRAEAGKSTITNALLERRVAQVGGGAGGAITWLLRGEEELARVRTRNGSTHRVWMSGGALPSELPAGPADIESIAVWLSTDALTHMTIIDTPPIDLREGEPDTSPELSQSSATLWAVDQADAVVYVFRDHLGEADSSALRELSRRLLDLQLSAFNSIGVVNVDCEPGGLDTDSIEAVRDRVKRSEDEFRGIFGRIVPAIGLFGQTGAVDLRESDARDLRAIARLPSRTRQTMLAAHDSFLEGDSDVPPDRRRRLLDLLGLSGLMLILDWIDGGARTATELATRLTSLAGVEDLRSLLTDMLSRRADALKAHAAVCRLERLTLSTPELVRAKGQLDDLLLEPDMHSLKEAWALRMVVDGGVRLRPDLVDDLQRLVLGRTTGEKLGPVRDDQDQLQEAIRQQKKWKALEANTLDRDQRRVASIGWWSYQYLIQGNERGTVPAQ